MRHGPSRAACAYPANPWAGITLRDLDRRRARRRGAGRRRPGHRGLHRIGLVVAAVLLLSAYSTGVSYGHWAVQAYAEGPVGMGTLTLEVTSPPPSFAFECEYLPVGPAGEPATTTCDMAAKTGGIDLSNTGTIPARARVGWGYGTGAGPGQCALFNVQLVSGSSVLLTGNLCDVVGNQALVSLNPRGSLPLDVVVAINPAAVLPTATVTLPLLSLVTWWQFNSNQPGSAGAYGWWGETQGAFQMQVIVSQGTRVIEGSAGEETPGATPPGEATTALTITTTPASTTSAPPATAPPEETTTTTTTLPPVEETTTTTTTTLPPEGTLTLRGRVWEDLDGNGVTVVDHPQQEPGVAGVEVVLRTEDGTRLAGTWTGAAGGYEFESLDPGRYRVEFRAPEGWGFRDPGVASVPAQQLAGQLGVAVEQVVVDDLHLAPVPDAGEQARAKTAVFDLDAAAAAGGGRIDGVADAAMLRLPEEAPEGSEAGDEAAPAPGSGLPGNEVEPGEAPACPIDPNTQAAKPEKPEPQTTPPPPAPPSADDQAAPGDAAGAPTDPGSAPAPPEESAPEGGPPSGEGEVAQP